MRTLFFSLLTKTLTQRASDPGAFPVSVVSPFSNAVWTSDCTCPGGRAQSKVPSGLSPPAASRTRSQDRGAEPRAESREPSSGWARSGSSRGTREEPQGRRQRSTQVRFSQSFPGSHQWGDAESAHPLRHHSQMTPRICFRATPRSGRAVGTEPMRPAPRWENCWGGRGCARATLSSSLLSRTIDIFHN